MLKGIYFLIKRCNRYTDVWIYIIILIIDVHLITILKFMIDKRNTVPHTHGGTRI